MDTKKINDILSEIQERVFTLEEEYDNNGGEVTDWTEQEEATIKSLQDVIASDGIDTIGRIIKSEEDRIATRKAEKDYIGRQITRLESRIEYFKHLMSVALRVLGRDEAKGSNGYKFTRYVSNTTAVSKETLRALYDQKIKDILTENHIPPYITVTLNASYKTVQDLDFILPEDEQIFIHNSNDTVIFTKPRSTK